MNIPSIFWIVPAASVVALSFAWAFYRLMKREDEGTPRMREIAAHVRKGAMAYLRQQYKVVGIVFAVLALFFAWLAYGAGVQNGWVPFAFITGGFFSGLAGYFGMKTATYASARTANAARQSLDRGLKVAFRSGAVMGLVVVGLGLLDISFWYVILNHFVEVAGPQKLVVITTTMLTFGMGASTQALFARVGGGIYTKAADVGADLTAQSGAQPALFEEPQKAVSLFVPRRFQRPFLHFVEADEVDVAGPAFEKGDERPRVFLVAVLPFDERIFKIVPPARLFKIIGAGFEDFGNSIRLRDGHHPGAVLVGSRVQRNGEIDGNPLVRQLVHLRHQAAGGQGNVAGADVQPLRRRDVFQKPHRFGIIVQRLPAAHEHDVGHGAGLFAPAFQLGIVRVQGVDDENLRQNFPCREISHQPAQRGRAEFTAHAAPHLRGNALRAAVFVLHQHPFDEVAVRKLEQVFFRPVRGMKDLPDFHGLVLKFPKEPIAEFRRKGGDCGNLSALRQAVEKLFRAEFFLAETEYQGFGLRKIQVL